MQDKVIKLPLPLATWVEISTGEIGTIDYVARVQGDYVYDVIVARCFRLGVRHEDIKVLDCDSTEIHC